MSNQRRSHGPTDPHDGHDPHDQSSDGPLSAEHAPSKHPDPAEHAAEPDPHDELFGPHDPEAAPARAARRPHRSPLRSVLPALLVLAVLLALGAGGYYGYRWVASNVSVDQEEADYPGPGDGEALVEVASGDSGSDIAKKLVSAQVLKSPDRFTSLFASSPSASSISPGTYRLKKHMSAQGALDLLQSPDALAGRRVTIPEGMRMSDIFPRLSKATGIPVAEFQKAAKDYRALGVPENPAKSAEGYLWPGRYDIPEKATAQDVLKLMVSRMNSELDSLGVAPKDRHRVLTIASIAEKEARTPEDYGKVVRTIDNRLAGVGEAKGHPMKLQLDSTVAYASGRSSISTTPKERQSNSPYNTYLHTGLPIGPIANPGAKTLQAALHPPAGTWLYWVTVNTDTGETVFSTNKADHDKAVKKWQDWYKAKTGRG